MNDPASVSEGTSARVCHVVGGGTVSHVRCHLSLAAVAWGSTARHIHRLCDGNTLINAARRLHLTRMAAPDDHMSHLETPSDLARLAAFLVDDPATRVVFWNPAVVDFEGSVLELNPVHREIEPTDSGKYEERLDSSRSHQLELRPAEKILKRFRQLPNSRGVVRKDIFLVAFKTTCGATSEQMYHRGLQLLKANSANLVLVNDVRTRVNLIVTPEEAVYHETTNRAIALENLVEMAALRSQLAFTRSTVVAGELVPWENEEVPDALRKAVDHCIGRGAYKPFAPNAETSPSTVGHFAVRISDTEFLTSIRKSNFNDLGKIGLVRVKTDGPDTVYAYGAKPSVGGQSQRQVFADHPNTDCILHFHSPLRPGHPDDIPSVSQRAVECGSMECGRNTSQGLRQFGNLKAVFLHNHGPNIVFPRDIDPQEVIDFIDRNFDLSLKTGGYQLPALHV